MAFRMSSDPVLPKPVADVLAAATGAEIRNDPTLPHSGGPAGNARLTAWGGMLLLVLFVVETFTLVSLGQMISLHIILGTVLVPLALLKTATTGWRILRYYTGNDAYREAGPPPLFLRLLGPLVILTALAVLGSGLALIPLGDASRNTILTVVGQRIDAVTIHKLCFAAWLVVVGLHVLTRTIPALQLVARTGSQRRLPVPGASARAALLVLTLAAGAVASAVVLHYSTTWTHGGWFVPEREGLGVSAPVVTPG